MGINPTPNGSTVRVFLNFGHTNGASFDLAFNPAMPGSVSNVDRDAAIESLVTHLGSWSDLASGPTFLRYEESQHDVTP